MARERGVKQATPPPGKAGRRASHPSSTFGTPGPRAALRPEPSLHRDPPRASPFRPWYDQPAARVATIPLALWVCAAVVAHAVGGGGAMKAAEVVHDRDELRAAVRFVRQSLHPPDTTFEVLTDDAVPMPAPNVAPPKDDSPDNKAADVAPDPDAVPDPAMKPVPPPKPKEEKKPEPPKVAEAPKPPPPEPPKPVPVMPVPAAPAPPPPPPVIPPEDHRIAVQQHAKKDQPDNPNAQRIADEANHVDKETIARNRSHDQDAKDPSFGASKGPKDDKPGSGDKEDKVADSEDKKGDDKHAPGEKAARGTAAHHEAPRPPVPPTPGGKSPAPSVPGGKGGQGSKPATPPPSPGGAGPSAAEVMASERGGFAIDPANPGGDGKSRTAGKKRAPSPFQSPVHVGSIGLGGTGLPGGPQINLDLKGVEAAVGAEQLKAERAADGAARRSAHRGGWEKNKFQKWKSAIENYEPTVELGNTTALNAARVPFATFINNIHNRIHPRFAEEFLDSLNSLSKSHQLNQGLVTHLEIVLNKDTGQIVRMGITKASGATAFDIAALASVDRAAPFGKAPEIIASPDGNVYLHWEFHRDPFDACTTRNARPYILKTAPKKPVGPLGPTRKGSRPRDEKPTGPLVPLRER